MKLDNWKTTVSGIGATLFALLGALAALPYSLGEIANILPSKHKETIFVVSAAAAAILKVWNSLAQQDAKK